MRKLFKLQSSGEYGVSDLTHSTYVSVQHMIFETFSFQRFSPTCLLDYSTEEQTGSDVHTLILNKKHILRR